MTATSGEFSYSSFALKIAAVLLLVGGSAVADAITHRDREIVTMNTPWPDAAHERVARVAAATRSLCTIAKVSDVRPDSYTAVDGTVRDQISLILDATRNTRLQPTILPYENEIDDQPNPHASRVRWVAQSLVPMVNGKVVAFENASRAKLSFDDSIPDNGRSMINLMPLATYPTGSVMSIRLVSSAESETHEDGSTTSVSTSGVSEDGHELPGQAFTRTQHTLTAEGSVDCGRLIKSRDAAGNPTWVIDKTYNKTTPIMREDSQLHFLDCIGTSLIESCYDDGQSPI